MFFKFLCYFFVTFVGITGFSAKNVRLITWRSQVQILPPQPKNTHYFSKLAASILRWLFAFYIIAAFIATFKLPMNPVSKTEFPAPGLLEPFLSEIWISGRGLGLLLRSLRFGDRGPLMGWQRQWAILLIFRPRVRAYRPCCGTTPSRRATKLTLPPVSL